MSNNTKTKTLNTTTKLLNKHNVDIVAFAANPSEEIYAHCKEIADYKGYGFEAAAEYSQDLAIALFGPDIDELVYDGFELSRQDQEKVIESKTYLKLGDVSVTYELEVLQLTGRVTIDGKQLSEITNSEDILRKERTQLDSAVAKLEIEITAKNKRINEISEILRGK